MQVRDFSIMSTQKDRATSITKAKVTTALRDEAYQQGYGCDQAFSGLQWGPREGDSWDCSEDSSGGEGCLGPPPMISSLLFTMTRSL